MIPVFVLGGSLLAVAWAATLFRPIASDSEAYVEAASISALFALAASGLPLPFGLDSRSILIIVLTYSLCRMGRGERSHLLALTAVLVAGLATAASHGRVSFLPSAFTGAFPFLLAYVALQPSRIAVPSAIWCGIAPAMVLAAA